MRKDCEHKFHLKSWDVKYLVATEHLNYSKNIGHGNEPLGSYEGVDKIWVHYVSKHRVAHEGHCPVRHGYHAICKRRALVHILLGWLSQCGLLTALKKRDKNFRFTS